MLWLAAYLTGFPPVGLHALRLMHGLAPMWSGLYIISTDEFEEQMEKIKCVSMPSRAYTSFLHAIELDSNSGILTVSMPSRAYTSFLRYPFKSLGFMRFTEPVFAGICQNILTTAIFRAC